MTATIATARILTLTGFVFANHHAWGTDMAR